MEISYLGISFIGALQELLRIVLSEVFAPILREILQVYVEYVLTVFSAIWTEWLLALLTILCGLVDFVENIFNVFAGIDLVEVEGQKTYLLDAFFRLEKVTTAFTYITVMAVAISFIFTIYKTAKSISDMALEDKNPISKVLADGMKAAVTFMLIPFLCICLLQIATLVTNQAVSAFKAGQGGSSSMGTIIFLSAGLDADKATTNRRNPVSCELEDLRTGRHPSFTDEVRNPYLIGEKDYRSIVTVKGDFHASNFNFIVGFSSGILILFILTGAIMIFIRRLFDLLLLYLVSPLFVATIPLDDGATFAKWRELFVAKFFSGFGVIFSMRYYLLLVPSIAGSELCLYRMNLPNAVMINSVLKMFMIIGGAWAVYKSQTLILQLLNQEAAAAEQQAGALMSGMIIGSVTTAANMTAAAASGGSTAALGGLKGLGGGAGGGMGGLGQIASAAGDLGKSAGDGRSSGDDKQRFRENKQEKRR